MTCKYCGGELPKYILDRHGKMCGKCIDKSKLVQNFVKVRDDLRERCGLERMDKTNAD